MMITLIITIGVVVIMLSLFQMMKSTELPQNKCNHDMQTTYTLDDRDDNQRIEKATILQTCTKCGKTQVNKLYLISE